MVQVTGANRGGEILCSYNSESVGARTLVERGNEGMCEVREGGRTLGQGYILNRV